ncbi:MAG: type II toxin-antitoxin system VapC family toxin [Rhodospirillaceae bacterium]|nr:type II toxin-antitoxin system VapC family toxin [Rhodospirillaceae bacterium]MDE0616882.1 type II toxin-antitoxin system VapC family toxin [Rhodospirillaceae bacterium]
MTKGLDTNVLLRLVVADEPEQTRAAETAVRRAADTGTPLMLNLVVLCEFAWVLRRSYGYSRAEIADCIETIGNSPAVIFQDPVLVAEATQWLRMGGDFADAIVTGLNRSLGADTTLTFERTALKLDGFEAVA